MNTAPATDACRIDGNHVMQCMEVWGGNNCIESSVSMNGLDAWVFSQPYDQATTGGDVYYVSSCATGRITRLLLADVTGHGTAVDAMAAGLRDLMRQFVNYIDQARFVQAMNEQFVTMSANGNFATAIVSTYFSPTRRLSLCNAGHPPPLLYRAAERRWHILTEDLTSPDAADDRIANLPLGVIDLADYDQRDLDLHKDDLVFCYTDALSEGFDAEGQMLGCDGLHRVVTEVPVGDPRDLIGRLLGRIRLLHPKNLVGDDVSVMLFRCSGDGTKMTISSRVTAPLRVMAGVADAFAKRVAIPWPEFSVANIGGAMWHRLGQGKRK